MRPPASPSDGAIRSRVRCSYPVATTIINLIGSLVLGLVTGLALGALPDLTWRLVIGTGLLGGYTTFSTASFEVARLLEERRWVAGVTHALATVVAATALAGVGLLPLPPGGRARTTTGGRSRRCGGHSRAAGGPCQYSRW